MLHRHWLLLTILALFAGYLASMRVDPLFRHHD
jgi:hypothetical protein